LADPEDSRGGAIDAASLGKLIFGMAVESERFAQDMFFVAAARPCEHATELALIPIPLNFSDDNF
jgi:hypothetical protein